MKSLIDFVAPFEFLVPIFLVGGLATYLEWQFPRRRVLVSPGRWLASVMLLLCSTLLGVLVLPVAGYAVARLSESVGSGLLNIGDFPTWLNAALTILALDFIAFLMHWLLHRYHGLWRIHRVHHSDNIVSASTSFLHHPFEALMVQAMGLFLTPILGLQAEGLLIFTGIQFTINIWHHSNIASFPGQYWLGFVIFTPEEHRVHHSAEKRHYNRNLGLIFTIWDRIFGTYIKEKDLDRSIRYGLDPQEWDYPDTITSLIVDPFRK